MSTDLFHMIDHALRPLSAERIRTTYPGKPRVGEQRFRLNDFGWELLAVYRATFEPEPCVTITSFELWNGQRRFLLPTTAIPGDSLAEMEGEIQTELENER